jgi:hypothetical protein
MMTQVLGELEDDGLVTRKMFLEVPPRVEYALTESGAELLPFIDLLKGWGQKQMERQGITDIHAVAMSFGHGRAAGWGRCNGSSSASCFRPVSGVGPSRSARWLKNGE